MISILVVDDSSAKQEAVREALSRSLPEGEYALKTAATVFDAVAQMGKEAFDLLILDMNLPRRAGASPQRDGGLEVLEQVERGRILKPTHVLGLTEFQDLADGFRERFAQDLWYLVRYDGASVSWESALARKVVHIAHSKSNLSGAYECDLAILTALQEELDAVLGLDAGWRRDARDGDDTIYYTGRFERGNIALRVVAASAIEMGMPTAAAMSMKLAMAYKPRVLALAGIAAGLAGAVGDILVADLAWDYGAGKISEDEDGACGFQIAPSQIPIDPLLKAKVAAFAHNRDAIARIQPDPKNLHSRMPAALMGPVASGSAVINSEQTISAIRQQQRKVIGVDMETYGVYVAARHCVRPRPLVISAKAASDRGSQKTDRRREAAAISSARFIYEFALAELALAPLCLERGAGY